MGFYGNVSNVTRSTFQFDYIYSNRLTMDTQVNLDGIYIGRYVLVEYDQDMDFSVFTRMYPVKKTITDNSGKEQEATCFYTAPQPTNKQNETELVNGQAGMYYYTADDVRAGNSKENRLDLKNIIFYLCQKDGAYILGEASTTVDNNKGFVEVSTLGNTTGVAYTDNYNTDLAKYKNARGYDSTVWMKTYAGDEIKYVMIAELNTVVPTFDVSVDPPSEIPNQPHFGKDSTNVYYDLHVQPSWGFRVKKAEDDAPSSEKIQQNYNYYDLNGELAGTGVKEVRGDIYYNKDGFKVDKSTHSSMANAITLSKGSSGLQVYNKHDGSIDHETAEDVQELSIHLPAIGNAVADLYDVLYGAERNTTVNWYYGGYKNGGLRLSQFFADTDKETGKVLKEGYKYNPDKMGTVAASINTLHDLVGMIIDNTNYKSSNYETDKNDDALKAELAQRKQQFINTSDENTIYYDTDTSKYFRKTIGYDYLDSVNYKHTWVENLDADNYQPNMYYIEDGTTYVPDLNGAYQPDKKYYIRSAVNDEYYDEVALTDYTPNLYYSLINRIYTKASGSTFDEALNYYDISNREEVKFTAQYKPGEFYLKNISSGKTTYSLYNVGYDSSITDDEKKIIYEGLSAIDTSQETKEVVFFKKGCWFYKAITDENADSSTEESAEKKEGSFYLADSLVKDQTYYLIPKLKKTKSVDAFGKDITIYTPLVKEDAMTSIKPEEYYILDYDDVNKDQWINCLFTTSGSNYVLTEPRNTEILDGQDGNCYTKYGNNTENEAIQLGGIKYIQFIDGAILYTPNTYYSEDATNPTDFSLDTGDLENNKIYYKFNPENQKVVHDNDKNYFYKPYDENSGASTIGYYFWKDDKNEYHVLTDKTVPTNLKPFYKRTSNDLYIIEDTNHIYDKYTVWNSNATIIPPTLTLKRRKEKYVFEELKEFGIQYNTLLGILLEARRVLSTSLDTPEETRDTSTVQGCINKLNDIFAYFDNRYPGQFLITDAYDRIVNAPITTAQSDTITNIGKTTTTNITTPMENRWIEVNINSDPVNPQIKYQHNFNRADDTDTSSNKNIPETGEKTGLNNTIDDTLSLYTPIVDEMGHVVGKNTETVVLPYGFKKVKVVNGAGADNTSDLKATATTTVIADNTQDQFSIETGNRWIRMSAVDGTDNKITIQHETHDKTTNDGTAEVELTTADVAKTFDIKSYSFDEAGHVDGTITTTLNMPTNYGIFTDGKNTTTARGTQSTMTVKGDDIHLSSTIGTDTIMFTHIGPDTATANTTTTLASNIVGGKEFALFGDSFTIANVSYDKQGHINGTSTFDIKIPEISATSSTAQIASEADVIKTITINSQTGEIDVSRENVGNLKLTDFTATETTSLTADVISAEDKISEAFNKVESRLNGAENKLDILQGDGEGSIAQAIAVVDDKVSVINGDEATEGSIKKAVADASTALTETINAVDGKVEIINGTEEQEGSIKNAIFTLSASIETDYVKKADYDALKQEVDALKALIEQYHPTSTDPDPDTGEDTGG